MINITPPDIDRIPKPNLGKILQRNYSVNLCCSPTRLLWNNFYVMDFPGLFLFVFVLSTFKSKYVHYKIALMTRFELWASGIRSNHSATAPYETSFKKGLGNPSASVLTLSLLFYPSTFILKIKQTL